MVEVPARSKFRWKKWLGGFVLLILLVYLTAVAFVEQLEKVFVNRILRKAELDPQAFEIWRTQKLTFPPEALTVEPYSESLVAAAEAFKKACETHDNKEGAYLEDLLAGDEKKGVSTAFLDPNFKPPIKELAIMESFLAAHENLVKQPDYGIDVTTRQRFWNEDVGISQPGFICLRTAARMMAVKTLSQSAQERHAEALATAENLIRGARVHAFSDLVCQTIGIAIRRIGVKAWDYAVDHCNDASLLRKTLQVQNQIASETNYLDPEASLFVADTIGQIRIYQRFGIAAEIQNRSGWELLKELTRVQDEYSEKIILPTLESNSRKRASLERKISNSKKEKWMTSSSRPSRFNLFGRIKLAFVETVLYLIATPSNERAIQMDCFAHAEFDLLRLTTARKIFTLEKGHPPERLAELVPDYLPQLPTDPFSSDRRPLGEKPFPYSIGPDGRDDQGQIIYDPTNGTASAGDVRLLSTQRQREEGKK